MLLDDHVAIAERRCTHELKAPPGEPGDLLPVRLPSLRPVGPNAHAPRRAPSAAVHLRALPSHNSALSRAGITNSRETTRFVAPAGIELQWVPADAPELIATLAVWDHSCCYCTAGRTWWVCDALIAVLAERHRVIAPNTYARPV